MTSADSAETERLALPFERRQIARQRVTLVSGRDAGLKLPRGTVLRNGDVLQCDTGAQVTIEAAPEAVSVVRCSTSQDLARAAYHLGNRHVWVQVGDGWLSYLHDHVLDNMLTGLGLSVESAQQPFEPEAGAYSSDGHSHAGGHSHADGHSHGHTHAGNHEH